MRKKCPSCGHLKDEADFYKSSASKNGLSSYCKLCAKKKATERHNKDAGKVRADALSWAHRNPGAAMASAYAWKKRNPDKVKAAAKKYYEKKKAERLAKKEALYQARLQMKEEIKRLREERI